MCVHGRYGIACAWFHLRRVGVCLREPAVVDSAGRAVPGRGDKRDDPGVCLQSFWAQEEGVPYGSNTPSFREARVGRAKDRRPVLCREYPVCHCWGTDDDVEVTSDCLLYTSDAADDLTRVD